MTPRFEFRAFAPNFGIAERNVRADAELVALDERHELYLISAFSEEHNVKVREGDIDVKRLLRREGELELWKPELRAGFPLSADETRVAILEPLGVDAALSAGEPYSLATILSEIVHPTPGLVAVIVDKERRSYRSGPNGSLRAEHTRVFVNGAGIETIAVESEDAELLSASLGMLGLDAYRNTSYVAALKTITGLSPFYETESAPSNEFLWAKSVWEKK